MAGEFSRENFIRFRIGSAVMLDITPAWLRVLSPFGAAPQILDPTGQGLVGVSAEIRYRGPINVIPGDILKAGLQAAPAHGRIFIVRQVQRESDANLFQCAEIAAPIPDEFDDERELIWTQLGGNVFFTTNEIFGGSMQTSLPAGTKPILEHALIQLISGDFDIWTRLRTDAGGAAVRNALIGLQIPSTLTGIFIGFRDNGASSEPVRYDVLTGTPSFVTTTSTGPVASSATYYYVRLRRRGRFFRTFFKTSPGEPVAESDWTQLHPSGSFFFSSSDNTRLGLFGFTNNSAAGIARWDFIRHWIPDSPTDSVMFNNVPICIHRNLTTVGNVGAGIDSLHSFPLPANSLALDGDWVRFTYSGTFAANDNDKRIRISIDGQLLEDFGLTDIDAGVWRVVGEYMRVSATTVRASSLAMYGEPLVADEAVIAGTPDIIFLPRNTLLTVANLNSNPVTLLVEAEATANDDVTQNKSIIELCRQ